MSPIQAQITVFPDASQIRDIQNEFDGQLESGTKLPLVIVTIYSFGQPMETFSFDSLVEATTWVMAELGIEE